MALLNRELVHHDLLHAGQVHGTQRPLQVGLVDGFDGLPVQIKPLGHVPDRQHLAQARHALGQPPREPRVGRQPRQVLQLRPAGRTGHTRPVDQQPGICVQEWQVPHPALVGVVDRRDALTAPAATPRMAADRM